MLRGTVKLWQCMSRNGTGQIQVLRMLTTAPNVVKESLHYLDGKRVDATSDDTSQKFDVLYPATGEVLCQVQSAGRSDVDAAVNSAKEAYKEWSQRSNMERGKVLLKAAEIVRSNLEDLARTEVLDTGKPIWEARLDIDGCAGTMEYYGGIAPSLQGEHILLPNGNFAYTRREPLGVVGGIGAWNYPFQMASWKTAPALVVGNTMVFKPSPLTPLTAVMLAEMYSQAGLPDGCLNIIQGMAETGALLSSHQHIEKMTFTGSVPTGSKVMEACAKDIKHVTLELGGKSPLIIFEDCDLENAVKGAMLANFMNQGQVCSNGTRVFVQRSILDAFLDKLVTRVKKMQIGDPLLENTTVGSMISKEQCDIALSYIESAKYEGATVLYGGEKVIPSSQFAKGNFLQPTILVNCLDNMKAVREEIFGSVMAVLTFDTEEEVLRRANDTQFGLAGGVFTKDLQKAHRVASKMEAGSLYINNYNVYPPEIPFGGYKKSGLGRENGAVTLNQYTQVKCVYVEMNDVDSGPL